MLNLKKGKSLLIAEIGGNHEGDLGKALELMFSAYEAGADIVKFQTYSADGLVNKNLRPDRYEHFRRFTLKDEEWLLLAQNARDSGINFSSSLWESRYIELLDDFICLYKVGSGDITNHQLIQRFLETNKPLVISTAMSNIIDINRTYEYILSIAPNILSEGKLGILQCTAMYNEPLISEVNLEVMHEYKNKYNCIIGFSDHSLGKNACLLAISLGAEIIEFHFTDNKAQEFRDHQLSLDHKDLIELSSFNNEFETLRGTSIKDILPSEEFNKKEFRRALFLKEDMKAGTIIKENDIISLRPDIGISAWDFSKIIGKRLNKDIKALEPLDKFYFDEL